MRKRLFAAGFGAIVLALCGFVGWKLVIASGPLPINDEYQRRLKWTAANVSAPAEADPDESFRIYAVYVAHTAPFKSPFVGYGIYLGNGTVITAAHVLGRWPSLTNPRILIAGQDLAAAVIKNGDPDQLDLALLSVNESLLPISLLLRRSPLCRPKANPGTRVAVIIPQGATSSEIISPQQIAPPLRARYGTLIDEAHDSGSGVFNADKKCLLGIISRKIAKFGYRNVNGHPTLVSSGFAGYFVPATEISGFIPPNVKL